MRKINKSTFALKTPDFYRGFFIKKKNSASRVSNNEVARFKKKANGKETNQPTHSGFATKNGLIRGTNEEGILAARARRAEVSDRERNKVGARFYKQTEREGFEPSVELPLHQFSRLTP